MFIRDRDKTSAFATCGLKLRASKAEMHGPVSQHVLHAVKASMTEQRAVTALTQDHNKSRAGQLMKRIMVKRSRHAFTAWAERAAIARGIKNETLKVVLRMLRRALVE